MKPRYLFRILLTLFFLSHVVAAQMGGNPRFTNLQIHVQVQAADGSAAPRGIAVVVEREGGGVISQGETDTQGKASFNMPAGAFYLVRINQPGYVTPPPQRADLNTASSAYLIFELKPLPAQGGAAMPPEGPGARVNANQIPSEALKEFKKGEDLLLKHQKSEESVSHFQKAIKLHESFPLAYVLLGMAYLDQRKPMDAQAALEKAIKMDDSSAAAHLELGAAFNQQKRYPDAERELKRGLELNPDAAEGKYELAKTYWAMGNVQEADAYATKAAELRPELPAVHVLLGNVALRKGDSERALKEFKEYLRLEPEGPMAQPVKDMIKKVEQSQKASK